MGEGSLFFSFNAGGFRGFGFLAGFFLGCVFGFKFCGKALSFGFARSLFFGAF